MDVFDLREPVSAWTHGIGFVFALPGTWLLARRCRGDRAKRWSVVLYGLCLSICLGGSALYHGVWATGDRLEFYHAIDHVGIYLLIAGTYTPLAWTLLRGAWRRGTLTLAWLSAALGIFARVACGELPTSITTGLYLAMGWGAVFCYMEIARVLPCRALRPIFLGGLAYSVGTVFHVTGWPVLWGGVFGGHEMFHLFVLAGSSIHYLFMIDIVAPFGTPSTEPRPAAPRERIHRAGWLWRGDGPAALPPTPTFRPEGAGERNAPAERGAPS